MEIALFIQNIQEERAEVKSHHFPLRKVTAPPSSKLLFSHPDLRWQSWSISYGFIYLHQVALYIFSRNQSNSQSAIEQPDKNRHHHEHHQNHVVIIIIRIIMNIIVIIIRKGIVERFRQTDRALEEVPTWPDVSSYCFPHGDVLVAKMILWWWICQAVFFNFWDESFSQSLVDGNQSRKYPCYAMLWWWRWCLLCLVDLI